MIEKAGGVSILLIAAVLLIACAGICGRELSEAMSQIVIQPRADHHAEDRHGAEKVAAIRAAFSPDGREPDGRCTQGPSAVLTNDKQTAFVCFVSRHKALYWIISGAPGAVRIANEITVFDGQKPYRYIPRIVRDFGYRLVGTYGELETWMQEVLMEAVR